MSMQYGLPPAQHRQLSEHEKQKARGKAFWNLCKAYGFGRTEQAYLLNKSPNNRGVLKNLEAANSFPDDEIACLNLSQLLGIHKNLGILYPHAEEDEYNRKLKYAWFRVKREVFGGLSAIEFIIDKPTEVFRRLTVVRRMLDVRRSSF